MKYSITYNLSQTAFWLLLIASIFATQSIAQTNTKSPYSFYGIGDLESNNFAQGLAMGDLKYGLSLPYQFNLGNPASTAALKLPVFQAGVKFNTTTTTSADASQKNANGYFRHFAIGLPVSDRWGLAFGLMPFSASGYSIIENSVDFNLGNVTRSYRGDGGINHAFVNVAYTPIKRDSSNLSIGITPAYYFGTLRRESTILFDNNSNAYNTVINERYTLSDINATLGINFKKVLRSKEGRQNVLSFGVVYQPERNMYNEYREEAFTTNTGGFIGDSIRDILSESRSPYPAKYGAGVYFETYDVNKKRRWGFGFDYTTTNWSVFSLDSRESPYRDEQQYSVGLKVTPNDQAIRNLFSIIDYRAGFRYTESRLVVNGKHVNDFGMSLGIGIPLLKSGTLPINGSSLNISTEFGRRGNVESGLIREDYINLVVGFNFVPGKFDRWFVKRKID